MRARNFTTGLDRALLLLDEVDELRATLAKTRESRDAYEARMEQEISFEHWSLTERALLRKTLKWFREQFTR